MTDALTEEALEALMVKVTDGVATAAERETLMAHLADHPELKKELEMHQSLKAITDGWVSRLEQDLQNDQRDQKALPRFWNTIGITLFLLGTAVLSGGGLVELMFEPSAPLWLKLGSGGLIAGTVMLLGSVAWRRFTTIQHDPYTEVIR